MINSSYERFALVYDQLMQDIPYDQYVNWVKTYAPQEQYPKLLDIGCGTGTLSLLFHQQDYNVSGIDLSEDMLAVAYERLQAHGASIPLFTMSMDELEGFSDLDVVTIPIDSINYVPQVDAVIETLKRIHGALREGGQLFLMCIHCLKWIIFLWKVLLRMMMETSLICGIQSQVSSSIRFIIK